MKNRFLLTMFLSACAVLAAEPIRFTQTFGVDKAELASVGTNPYFVLRPGYQLVLSNKANTKVLVITVLAETKMVDGVETRVVEEKETEKGEVVEISRNYFAISKRTNDVYYFGEDVDLYKGGKIANHEGSWLSGVAGARFGLMMPGTPLIGARFQQEVAPKIAMDRSEVTSVNEAVTTPAGSFDGCVKMEETTPIESGKEHKIYATGVGFVSDGELLLTKYGEAK